MDRLDTILENTFEDIRRSRLPESVKLMVYAHLRKPWVKNFRAIAISPLKMYLDDYLGADLGTTKKRRWYYPSRLWWESHAKTSHPPKGKGCDVDAHEKYLTEGGEFLYANIFKNGSMKILGRNDFEDECDWWGGL